jgi:hypothetical protein
MREEGVFEEMRQWGHPHVLSEKKKNRGENAAGGERKSSKTAS